MGKRRRVEFSMVAMADAVAQIAAREMGELNEWKSGNWIGIDERMIEHKERQVAMLIEATEYLSKSAMGKAA